MQKNETVTVTISQFEIDFLKECITLSDGATQAVCKFAAESMPFEDGRISDQKVLLAKVSLKSTELALAALKILTGVKVMRDAQKDSRESCNRATHEHCKQAIRSSTSRIESLISEVSTFMSERFDPATMKKISPTISQIYHEIGHVSGKADFL